MKTFTFMSMPFVLAEVGTGIASYITGQLSIPPVLGLGTAIDLGILVAGLLIALARVTKRKRSDVDVEDGSKSM